MQINYTYGNNINDLSDEAREIIKTFINPIYFLEYSEIDVINRDEPLFEFRHLFVFTVDDENNIKKNYFCREISYINQNDTEPYNEYNYNDEHEELLQEEMKRRENNININLNEI